MARFLDLKCTVKMLQRAHSPQLVVAKRRFRLRGYGVSERTTIKWINSLHFEDSLQLAAGSFNLFEIEVGGRGLGVIFVVFQFNFRLGSDVLFDIVG